MKKILLVITLMLGATTASIGQVNQNALGLRGGSGNYGAGVELTYQKGMGDDNRLELDLGLRSSSNNSHFVLTGIYHWVKNITNDLNWYIGPGVQLGLFQHKNNFIGKEGITIGLGGQIGIEFDFNSLDIPLLLSIDTRPMLGFVGGVSGFNYGGNLALRYTF